MAGNLRTIRRRIAGVKNTRQLTRAMKMVAAAKLRRSQERVEGGRPYLHLMQSMIAQVSRQLENVSLNPLSGPNRACLVFTSDRGLCGSYNSNIIKAANQLRKQDPQMRFMIFGKKGLDFARKNGIPTLATHPHFFAEFARYDRSFSVASNTMELVLNKLREENVGTLEAIYTRFVSAGVQKLDRRTIFPFALPASAASTTSGSLVIEPEPKVVLDALVRLYSRFSFFQIAAEVVASENGARMTAMDAATRNAKEMVDKLTLAMNRARQASITKELLEIISGAEALE